MLCDADSARSFAGGTELSHKNHFGRQGNVVIEEVLSERL
jgi:hypothetical protein